MKEPSSAVRNNILQVLQDYMPEHSQKLTIDLIDRYAQAVAEEARIDELSRYGYPKELTKQGMDVFWERTDELQSKGDGDG